MIEPLRRQAIRLVSVQEEPRSTVAWDLHSFVRLVLVALAWIDYGQFLSLYSDAGLPKSIHLLESVFFVSASLALVGGWQPRKVAVAFGAFFFFLHAYNGDLYRVELFQSHHLTLFALFFTIMGIAPSKRVFRGLLSSVYFYAAVSKMTVGSLTGVRLYAVLCRFYFDSVTAPWNLDALFSVASAGVLLTEIVFCLVVWNEKWSARCLSFALFFHALMYFVLPVGTFSMLMALLWLLVTVSPENFRLTLSRDRRPLTR